MCDVCLTSEKLRAQLVVRRLSDLTMIATDEKCFSSGTASFMSCKKKTSTQQSQRKNDRISHSSHLKKNNQLYQCLKNDTDCRLTAQFSIVKLL